MSFGRRGTVYRGSADLQEILQTEVNMRHPEDIEAAQGDAGGAQEFSEKMQSGKEKMLVMGKYYSVFAYQV